MIKKTEKYIKCSENHMPRKIECRMHTKSFSIPQEFDKNHLFFRIKRIRLKKLCYFVVALKHLVCV